jgi:F-type H+-transporting ATPase subunit b
MDAIIKSLAFDVQVFGGMILLFLALWAVTNALFWKPVLARLEARDQEIRHAHARVENLRHEMEDLRADYQTRITQVEAEARTRIQNAIKEAQAERERILKEARAESDAMLQQGIADMEREKAQALVELRATMVALAVNAADKALGSRADVAALQKAIETHVRNAGNGSGAARN